MPHRTLSDFFGEPPRMPPTLAHAIGPVRRPSLAAAVGPGSRPSAPHPQLPHSAPEHATHHWAHPRNPLGWG